MLGRLPHERSNKDQTVEEVRGLRRYDHGGAGAPWVADDDGRGYKLAL